jgi:peptidoglycan hydrolase-like protein with peptidoglycan-binding domain
LQDAGYYKGRLTGEIDPATESAIARFKRDQGLGTEPVIDSGTEKALLAVAQENRDSKYLALLLESTSGSSSLYKLSANGKQLFEGDKISELTSAINSERARRGRGNNIYLILKGFTDEKADSLVASFRLQQKSIDSRVTIRPFQSSLDSTSAEDFFFSPGKSFLEDSITPAVLVVGGVNDGYYGSSFTVRDAQNHTGTISVFAKIKQVVIDFVDGSRTLFQSRQADWSPAKIATVARARLSRKFGLSPEGVRVEFKDEVGNRHIADTSNLRVVTLSGDFE